MAKNVPLKFQFQDQIMILTLVSHGHAIILKWREKRRRKLLNGGWNTQTAYCIRLSRLGSLWILSNCKYRVRHFQVTFLNPKLSDFHSYLGINLDIKQSFLRGCAKIESHPGIKNMYIQPSVLPLPLVF